MGKERFELSRFYSLDPKSSAATNYATCPIKKPYRFHGKAIIFMFVMFIRMNA